MVDIPGHCPSCGSHIVVPLPVEPLFNREEVCALVPVKLTSLWRMSQKYKEQLSKPVYLGRSRRGKRMFTAQDIRFLRAVRLRSVQ